MADARGLKTSDQIAHYVGPTFAHCGRGLCPGRLVARDEKYSSLVDWGDGPDDFFRWV